METEQRKRRAGAGRILSTLKRPCVFIKNKTEKQREFLGAGRPGGMIASLLVSARFLYWMPYETMLKKVPVLIVFLLTTVFAALCAELLMLAARILFGGGKRSQVYFLTALLSAGAMNIIANQGDAIPSAVFMSLVLAVSADVLGRCIWSILKGRCFRQVFAYAAGGLCLALIVCYGVLYRTDSFGESRVAHYVKIRDSADAEKSAKAEGFDKYLEDGPFAVGTLSYGPGGEEDIVTDTVDLTPFASEEDFDPIQGLTDLFSPYDLAETPVRGQIWYPEAAGSYPTLFMVHGAHDSDVPSYLGYDYLGRFLASAGYTVVSVDENIINELGEGNDMRAILLLDNMKALLAENEKPESPIRGLIDPERLAIGGHSRGGEMVADAYLFNDLDVYPENGNLPFDYHFNISSILAIAPVVDQYRPAGQSVRISDVNYLLIHGSNDQDVSSMMGEKQYNNVTFTGKADRRFLKASVYILGANHGQFNSLWGRYDLTEGLNGFLNTNHFLTEADQQRIAKAYIRTFLDATIGGDPSFVSLLSDPESFAEDLPETVYVENYEDPGFVGLCSFDGSSDISDFGEGVGIRVTGTDTWTIEPYVRGDGGEGEDYVLSLSYKEGGSPTAEAEFPAVDIAEGAVSFRMADMREKTEDRTEGLSYTVRLTDASGGTAEVSSPELIYPSFAVQLYKQDALFGTYEYKHQLQTVTVRPEMFGEAGNFDFHHVTGLAVTVNGSEEGELILNDLGYYE